MLVFYCWHQRNFSTFVRIILVIRGGSDKGGQRLCISSCNEGKRAVNKLHCKVIQQSVAARLLPSLCGIFWDLTLSNGCNGMRKVILIPLTVNTIPGAPHQLPTYPATEKDPKICLNTRHLQPSETRAHRALQAEKTRH